MRSRIAASRCDPNPDSYFHRGSARYRRGEIDAGIEDFCETISLEAAAGTAEKYTSRTPQAFAERGRAFADKGEPERAIADYDAAIQRRFTKAWRPYIERGLARKRQGDHRGALADFRHIARGLSATEGNGGGAVRARQLSPGAGRCGACGLRLQGCGQPRRRSSRGASRPGVGAVVAADVAAVLDSTALHPDTPHRGPAPRSETISEIAGRIAGRAADQVRRPRCFTHHCRKTANPARRFRSARP